MAGGGDRKSRRGGGPAGPGEALSAGADLRKEFRYTLQIEPADLDLLASCREQLARGAAQFAEIYYNYLFDNPAIADVLYAYERRGGDVGDLVRSQLQQLLQTLRGRPDENLREIGRRHFQVGVQPVWVMGAWRLFLSHLQQVVETLPGLDVKERERLRIVLTKVVFQDMGLMLQGYWDATVQQLAQAQERMADERDRLTDLLSGIPLVLWSVDVRNNRMLHVSPAAERLCPGDQSCPVPCLALFGSEEQERIMAAWEAALTGEQAVAEVRALREDGEHWYRVMLYPVRGRSGRGSRSIVSRVEGVIQEITETHEALARLERVSTSDELTTLANRALWLDLARQALLSARREGDRQVGVLLLDIEHFRVINETLGHEAGDVLLRQVAERIRNLLRESDTLARFGGDEFAVLMPLVRDARLACERVAEKIVSCFEDGFVVDGREVFLRAGVGIAVFPDDGSDVEALLGNAEVAMYRARRSERGFAFYERRPDQTAEAHLQYSADLQSALDRQEFELFYQPKVEVENRSLCGAEALLRWRHPREGLLGPLRFLPVAERTGLMGSITDWVLRTALRQNRRWRHSGVSVPVSVNVSARVFQIQGFSKRVGRLLEEAGAGPGQLEIEITEETLMADFEHGARTIAELNELGVAVAVDDFGTGYSSLSYLKRLPIHTLKIDKSFLHDIEQTGNDAVLVRSIIDLGHNLGCRVVAEGVETAQVWQVLSELGCDVVQGYHVSRPLETARFDGWLRETSWSVPG